MISGVPQGSVLGPLLFLIYINDLPESVRSSTRLFADDCILYRQVRDKTDQLQLQEDLDSLEAWEEKWGMDFHPHKCNALRISSSKPPFKHTYQMKGVPLEEEESTKYLGVDLQSNLAWKTHINRVTRKSNNMLGFVRRNLQKAN